MSGETYYKILGVDPAASASDIRKAYLKASLKWHPDKNPGREDEAKAMFVKIGQAYDTLSDPSLRSQYDRSLRYGRRQQRPSSSNNSNTQRQQQQQQNSHHQHQQQQWEEFNFTPPPAQSYDNYRDAFDATMAGMSEAELRACLGSAALFGSVVGSIVGRRLLGGRNGGGSFLGSVGSIAGSVMASHMAQDSVLALHEESRERVMWKQACQRALERGEPMPEPPKSKFKLAEIAESVQRNFQANHRSSNNGNNSGTTSSSPRSSQHHQQTSSNNQNENAAQQSTTTTSNSKNSTTIHINVGDLWKKAARGVQEALNSANCVNPNMTAADSRSSSQAPRDYFPGQRR
jgi:curved DNA-binding protein CbpA